MSTPTARHDAQTVLQRPVPTIPACGRCGRKRVLYMGICDSCTAAEEREAGDR